MTTTVVPVPGGRLHVVDEGSREHSPIVLLHAGIADLRAWDEMMPSLVDAGYRVVRYDGRGFGASMTEDVEFSDRADAIADIDVRMWVDGPGQPETRVPTAIRDKVRAMDTRTTRRVTSRGGLSGSSRPPSTASRNCAAPC